jgi:hypothetical protein
MLQVSFGPRTGGTDVASKQICKPLIMRLEAVGFGRDAAAVLWAKDHALTS